MADKKISELVSLAGKDVAATDLFPVVDVSVTETKSLTRDELRNAVNAIHFTATKALATLAAASLPDDTIIEVAADESLSGARTRYAVAAGALVFDYGVTTKADLADASDPAKGAALVGYDGGDVQDVLDDAKPMSSYSALRAYTGRSTGVRITTPGIAGFFQRDADTTTADNGGTVIVDASGRRWKRVISGAVYASWFGVKANEIDDDTTAAQLALDSLQQGQELVFTGRPLISGTLFSNKSHVILNFEACEMKVSHSSGFSLVIHGGTLTRTYATYIVEIVEQAYEDVTPCVGVKVKDFKVSSSTGSRKATQMLAYFCDDLAIDATVKNSNGSGVELRHCVRPSFGKIHIEDTANFALFVYQCHGLKGNLLFTRQCGRPYEIKQRHKFHDTLDHVIDTVRAIDCTGVGDPGWATCGHAYNDLVRAGASAAAQANRNFSGHEICRNIKIHEHDFSVSDSAGASVTCPSVHISAYTDAAVFDTIRLDANGADTSTTPIVIGTRGDIAEGLAGGATFGRNHTIGRIIARGYQATNVNAFISYSVSATIHELTIKDSTLGRIVRQQDNTAIIPFTTIDKFEIRKSDIDIVMPLGATNERGIGIFDKTLLFVSGGLRIKVKPINSAANTVCCPLFVDALNWHVVGRDVIEVVDGGAGASNHAATYGVIVSSPAGWVNVKATVTAPTTAYGLLQSKAASTKALTIAPCEFVLTGAPTGVKDAIRTDGEVNLMPGSVTSGAWTNAFTDTSGKNSQNARRTVYLTAAPTTGTWARGDRVVNIAPSVGIAKGWICTLGGTPGTWTSEGNL